MSTSASSSRRARTDLDGAPIGLQSQSILATNGVLHETLLAELNR